MTNDIEVHGKKGQERRSAMALRVQTAYRGRMGRRVLWRKRKLRVHAQESRAAVTIQCAIRIYLAQKKVKRQKALVQYLKFIGHMKPGMQGMRPDQIEAYAAVQMQAAWRRRQAYAIAKRMKGAKVYYSRMQHKFGGKISMDEVHDLAASKMQAIWKGKQARKARADLLKEKDKALKAFAAVKIQRLARGRQARKRVQAEKDEKKMKRLAGFFRSGCFLKCWMTWVKFTDEAAHFKEVVGRTLGRWINMGMVRGFNALRMYSDSKKEKRLKVHNAALLAAKKENGPRDRIWGYWADYMDDLRELWAKVGEKCSSFLHLLTGDFVRLAFSEWKELMMKDRKAKKRRIHYKVYTAWKGWKFFLGEIKHFRSIEATIRSKWARVTLRMRTEELKDCVDELLYNRSLVMDAVLVWQNKTVIHAFRSLYEFAQAQVHYRKTVAIFRRRYNLRGVLPMARAWREIAGMKAEHKRIAKKAALRVYRRTVVSMWEFWRGVIRDRKLADREMAAKGSKTLMRIAKRPMAVGFEKWRKFYAEQKRNNQIFGRIAYRWRNANVVLTFNNWTVFVDLAIEDRRVALRNAVMDAMQRGDLASLLRTAKQQHRKYHRANLEEVMREVLEEEHTQVSYNAGNAPLHRAQPRDANPFLPGGASRAVKPRPSKRSKHPSPPRARSREGPDGGGKSVVVVRDLLAGGGGGGGGGGGVPMPEFVEGPVRGAGERKKKAISQILPPYLRQAALESEEPEEGRPSSEGRAGGRGNAGRGADAEERARQVQLRDGVAAGLAMQGPGDGPLAPLAVGEPTAYPLLGFDAELPQRTLEAVKHSLDGFEAVTRAHGARAKPKLFPPIRQSKTAWPQIDDSAEHAVAATATIQDAQPDVTLPPVAPAPITMPVIVDD